MNASMSGRATAGAGRGLTAKLVVVALAVVAGPWLAAAPVAAQAQPQAATISEIVDNPSAFYGKTVTVTGAVEDVLGARSFTIEDDDFLSDDSLPIIAGSAILNRAGGPLDTTEVGDLFGDQVVVVTGEVHQFNLSAWEERIGVDLEDDAWGPWAGRPGIIATSIRPTSGWRGPLP